MTAPAIPRDYNFAADILKRNLDAGRGGKTAFIDHRGTYSYADLAERVERFGHVLRSLGIRREERILICLLDTIDWPTAFLGAIKAGVVAVPVNTLMTEDDYRFMLDDSRARLLVVSEELLPKFSKAIGATSDCLAHVIVSGDERARPPAVRRFAGRQPKPKPVTAATTRDDMCFWLYTSGSTGKPKGAVHTHADLKLTDDLYAAPILGITENDICYSVAKLFFAYGLGNALTFPMSAGATTVLLPQRPTPDLVADILKKHEVTVFYAVPTFYAAFLASPAAPERSERKNAPLRLRRRSAAARYRPALERALRRRHPRRHRLDRDAAYLRLEPPRRREIRHHRQAGARLRRPPWSMTTAKSSPTRGEMGELQVRGPTSAIMYWNNREQSRATFLGEWTRSGDKYIEDDDGYFVYCGRRDDMLKVSGMYVSPFEVEGALQSHPDVLEAAVVGWPDTDKLIKPKAFVVLKVAGQGERRVRAKTAGRMPEKACGLQISALDRVPHRAAENRDRKDPALQAARRGRGAVTALRRLVTACVNTSPVLLRCPLDRRGSSAGRAPHS